MIGNNFFLVQTKMISNKLLVRIPTAPVSNRATNTFQSAAVNQKAGGLCFMYYPPLTSMLQWFEVREKNPETCFRRVKYIVSPTTLVGRPCSSPKTKDILSAVLTAMVVYALGVSTQK